MYVHRLSLENIRCFGERQTLELTDVAGAPAQWTIILGENGVGKTTLLQALHTAYPRRDATRTNAISAAAEFGRSGVVGAGAVWLEHAQPESRTLFQYEDGYSFTRESGEATEVPCFGYGASRRMGDAAIVKHGSSNVDWSAASLFNDEAPLSNVEEWLLQADYAAKSSKRVHLRARFDQIKATLIRLLPDVEGFRIVGLEESRPQPSVEADTPYGWVPIRRLSLGYKALMAWVVDLASRLFEHYPDSAEPLTEAAVVLVDEIDLHLHPAWQRGLVGFLSERFPKVQFIATAHSPLMVQAAATSNLAVLRRQGDRVLIENSPGAVYGWRVDQILTSPIFGLDSARPPHLDALLEERQAIMTKPGLSEADKRRVAELDRDMEQLPFGEDPEEIAARALIKQFAERLRVLEGL